MNKAVLLKIVNPVMGTLFLTQAFSGMFHGLVQGWSYEVWSFVHGTGGFVFVFFVVSHIILNWSWIKNTFLRKKNRS
jgi:hypothetical protein